jgi:hypothetical protein
MKSIESARAPWLARLYEDPIRYVEEIATVEARHQTWSFSGWYDSTNPTIFMLIRTDDKGSQSVYLYAGGHTTWCLQQVDSTAKFYLQTDRRGAQATLATRSVALTGTVRYFHLSPAKLATSQLPPPPNVETVTWSIDETVTVGGSLCGIRIRGLVKEQPVVSASTPFLCPRSAMIGVETDDRHRRRGLGRHAVGLLIHRLLERGIAPVYATDTANVPSMHIANTFFQRHADLQFLFVGPWKLRRPKDAPDGLPDSLFMS